MGTYMFMNTTRNKTRIKYIRSRSIPKIKISILNNLWKREKWFLHNSTSNKIYLFKGYLHYKTITSQNVSSEALVKNVFIS